MAATISAWGKPGAWALDSEENESELLKQQNQISAAVVGAETADYPSLAAAASMKTKKKKPQTLSIQEFATYSAAKPRSKGFTSDEMLILPTGPRERSAEELERGKLGGGFRSYGGGLRDDQVRRQGGFSRDSNREFASSRADEIDDWGAGKKVPLNIGVERRERGGFFGDSQNRADDVDDWNLKKSFVPSQPRKYERGFGFGVDSSNGGADSDNWVKRKEEEGGKIGGSFDSLRDKRGGFESNGADSESWGRKREEGSGGGRPRLNLQPRTLPVGEEKKNDAGNVVKHNGSNLFGEARPREEVLKEKGQDWKEIEEKLEPAKMKDAASLGSGDGPAVESKSFWSGRERLQQGDKTERAWRRPESFDYSSPNAKDSTNGHAKEAEYKDTQM